MFVSMRNEKSLSFSSLAQRSSELWLLNLLQNPPISGILAKIRFSKAYNSEIIHDNSLIFSGYVLFQKYNSKNKTKQKSFQIVHWRPYWILKIDKKSIFSKKKLRVLTSWNTFNTQNSKKVYILVKYRQCSTPKP